MIFMHALFANLYHFSSLLFTSLVQKLKLRPPPTLVVPHPVGCTVVVVMPGGALSVHVSADTRVRPPTASQSVWWAQSVPRTRRVSSRSVRTLVLVCAGSKLCVRSLTMCRCVLAEPTIPATHLFAVNCNVSNILYFSSRQKKSYGIWIIHF